ncbi:unnamed protein product [Brassica rapa]|uniref:Uncharacterized protein n=1 Tax=Brassica campestris TaxID=3711 RepID=A0A3P6APX6_BRACM|nr:unnamed protein product [Brassica rapa]VDC86158.1 unnamed protein product [Brassica rapa]
MDEEQRKKEQAEEKKTEMGLTEDDEDVVVPVYREETVVTPEEKKQEDESKDDDDDDVSSLVCSFTGTIKTREILSSMEATPSRTTKTNPMHHQKGANEASDSILWIKDEIYNKPGLYPEKL